MTSTNAKPAGATSGGHREIQVIEWKPFEKNTLQGFLSIELPSGLIIHGVTLHRKNDSRWIGLPGRQYTKPDGTSAWMPVNEIKDKQTANRFRDAVLAALDQHLAGGGE